MKIKVTTPMLPDFWPPLFERATNKDEIYKYVIVNDFVFTSSAILNLQE
jgi:hypothetical protein